MSMGRAEQVVLVKPERPKTSGCSEERGRPSNPSTHAGLQASKLKETKLSRRSLSFPQEDQVPDE